MLWNYKRSSYPTTIPRKIFYTLVFKNKDSSCFRGRSISGHALYHTLKHKNAPIVSLEIGETLTDQINSLGTKTGLFSIELKGDLTSAMEQTIITQVKTLPNAQNIIGIRFISFDATTTLNPLTLPTLCSRIDPNFSLYMKGSGGFLASIGFSEFMLNRALQKEGLEYWNSDEDLQNLFENKCSVEYLRELFIKQPSLFWTFIKLNQKQRESFMEMIKSSQRF